MNLDLIIEKLIPLVDKAGTAILKIYQEQIKNITIKGDDSPLTQADLDANEILVHGLKAYWPHIPILSEESGNLFSENESPEYYWAIDPLDGTKEFIKRNGEFTVNVALVHEGNPVLGLVLAPALDQLYVGYLSRTASYTETIYSQRAQKRQKNIWSNISVVDKSKKIISAMQGRSLRVACSRSHPSIELTEWLGHLDRYEAIEVGSSLKFCLIAEGTVDIYPRFGPTCIWDTAAGHAILCAAGGHVLTIEGLPLRYPKPFHVLNECFIASFG